MARRIRGTISGKGPGRIRRVEFDRKSCVDGDLRNEIAELPIRQFTRRERSPHGTDPLSYRDARVVGIVEQVADNRSANVRWGGCLLGRGHLLP